MSQKKVEFNVGDLVIYTNPRQFFLDGTQSKGIFGIITQINLFHVKVLWSDEVHCLEMFEDLSLLERTNY